MRISPHTGKKFGIILDQAGNLQRLGFPEDVEDYSLPTKQASTGGGGQAPTKPCPACGRIVLSFIVKCPDCAHKWNCERPINTENMVEIYSNDQARKIRDVPTLIELYHGHRRRAFKSNRGPSWADRAVFDLCGRAPNPSWCYGSLFGSRPTWDEQLEIVAYLYDSAKRGGGKPGDWVISEFEKEVGAGSWFKISQYKSKLEEA
mgnify:CR=1 FL=1